MNRKSKVIRRSALSLALGLCVAGGVQAQSTTGTIYGSAPAGHTIVVSGENGVTRTVSVDASGRYNLSALPGGNYTVVVKDKNGQTLGQRGVTVLIGSGANVSFASGDAATLETVNVTAASAPKIDVTQTDTRTVITAEQLARLPIARSVEAIALLAPGAASGNGRYFGNAVSFGGSSVAENAYYINGFYIGNPMTNVGGYSLPWGAIAQQQTLTGGYGAQYGRSAGGVISQVGASGSNDLHFGAQISIRPKGWRSDYPDRNYSDMDFSAANSNPNLPKACGPDADEQCQYRWADPSIAGTLASRKNGNYERSDTVYSTYVSGPLIKDKLFGFVSSESTLTDTGQGTGPQASVPTWEKGHTNDWKLYVNLDWNITDNHLLEYTYMGQRTRDGRNIYDYDFASNSVGEQLPYLQQAVAPESLKFNMSVLKYTGYLTDNLTFEATYGRSRQRYRSISPAAMAGIPSITTSLTGQNPAITGGSPINGQAGSYTVQGVDAVDDSSGLRADLQWVLGDHTLTFGVDNMKFEAENEGQNQMADDWRYSRSGNTYYVRKIVYDNNTNMSLKQNAYYLQDNWQITDNFLLSLGLRNDKFTNYNGLGQAYVESGDQWAPRVGFAWDVFGDSSLKVFGNAGRYFLALPNAVAVRGAGSSTYTIDYFRYTGIDPVTGVPTGLTQYNHLVANGENGAPVDPKTVTATDLKNMYQDEFVLGFEKSLGEKWTYGAKAVYRDLKQAVDDICDPYRLGDKAGMTFTSDSNFGYFYEDDNDGSLWASPYCHLANPSGNTFTFAGIVADPNSPFGYSQNGQYKQVKMTAADWGWPSEMKRTYKAIELYLEHPFDGKWEGRIDYVYSKLQGNTEGPANSDTGQGSDSHDNGVSTSQNWDVAEIMAYANGYLANDHRHQIKLHGSYAFNDQWSVSANGRIMSGSPLSCFGYYNPDGSIDEASEEADPVSYRSSYHTCFGQPYPPGKKFMPWTHQWDFGVTWKPSAFDNKLALNLSLFNAFNSRTPTSFDTTAMADNGGDPEISYTVNNTFGYIRSFQAPRYLMFTLSYDY